MPIIQGRVSQGSAFFRKRALSNEHSNETRTSGKCFALVSTTVFALGSLSSTNQRRARRATANILRTGFRRNGARSAFLADRRRSRGQQREALASFSGGRRNGCVYANDRDAARKLVSRKSKARRVCEKRPAPADAVRLLTNRDHGGRSRADRPRQRPGSPDRRRAPPELRARAVLMGWVLSTVLIGAEDRAPCRRSRHLIVGMDEPGRAIRGEFGDTMNSKSRERKPSRCRFHQAGRCLTKTVIVDPPRLCALLALTAHARRASCRSA